MPSKHFHIFPLYSNYKIHNFLYYISNIAKPLFRAKTYFEDYTSSSQGDRRRDVHLHRGNNITFQMVILRTIKHCS
jgi:hypothetical protein